MSIKELKAAVAKMAKIANKDSQICVGGDILGLPTHEIAYTHYTEVFDLDRVWVNFARFKKIVSKLKKDVSFKVDGALCIVAGGSTFKLKIEEPNLEMPKNEYEKSGTLPESAIPIVLKCAKVAESNVDLPALGCVSIEKSGTVVGSSLFCLYYEDTDATVSEDMPVPNSVIPLLSNCDYEVGVGRNQISLSSGFDKIEFVKPQSKYPEWRMVLPDTEALGVLSFGKTELLERLNEASIIGEFVKLSEDLGEVKIQSQDIETGAAYESILENSICPDEVDITFRIDQYAKIIQLIDADLILVSFHGRRRNAIINDCALLTPVITS